jgi:hypothetical protein
MQALFGRHRRRLVVLVVAGLVVAGGVAYATIPDGGNVYTACMLKGVGTTRLIDPSLGSSSAMGHCTSVETKISWHQQGQKGDPGAPGQAGKDGTNGVSPTVAQLASGDSHCAAGGAAITDAAGTTAYVCSGQDGKDFAGTFTSPNGQFSLAVDDTGVQITGPQASVKLSQDFSGMGVLETVADREHVITHGDLDVEIFHDETHYVAHDRVTVIDHDDTYRARDNRTETVDNNQTTTIHGNRAETVDRNQSVAIHGNRTETVGGALGLESGGALGLTGTTVAINGGGTCQPAARIGDLVNAASIISTGSATVCIGG